MRKPMVVMVWAVFLSSCGNGSNGNPSGDGDLYLPCQPRPDPGALDEVDLRVDSPLPSEVQNCPAGNIDELGVYLSIPTEDICHLGLSAAGVSGCCPHVDTNQNAMMILVYRHLSANLPMGEQVKNVELPTTSPPVVDLTFEGRPVDDDFYDTDGDSTGNLTEWCQGASWR